MKPHIFKSPSLHIVKRYIKSKPWLWSAIRPIARFRAWLIGAQTPQCRLNYSDVVVGGELLVRVSNIPGDFYLSARSDLAKRAIFDGSYEPEVTAALKEYSDSKGTIVNVGANVGFFAVFFAHTYSQAKRIVAIEPNPEAFAYLQRNIARNNLKDRIDILNTCVGADEMDVEFCFVDGIPEYSSVEGIVHPAAKGKSITRINVPQKRLSDLLDGEPVGLIFVDVEGAEERVFRGAEKTLRSHRPKLFFECSDILLRKFGGSSSGLVEYLTSLGYTVRDPFAQNQIMVHPYEGEAIAF